MLCKPHLVSRRMSYDKGMQVRQSNQEVDSDHETSDKHETNDEVVNAVPCRVQYGHFHLDCIVTSSDGRVRKFIYLFMCVCLDLFFEFVEKSDSW